MGLHSNFPTCSRGQSIGVRATYFHNTVWRRAPAPSLCLHTVVAQATADVQCDERTRATSRVNGGQLMSHLTCTEVADTCHTHATYSISLSCCVSLLWHASSLDLRSHDAHLLSHAPIEAKHSFWKRVFGTRRK